LVYFAALCFFIGFVAYGPGSGSTSVIAQKSGKELDCTAWRRLGESGRIWKDYLWEGDIDDLAFVSSSSLY
jgi:hypothetical protein